MKHCLGDYKVGSYTDASKVLGKSGTLEREAYLPGRKFPGSTPSKGGDTFCRTVKQNLAKDIVLEEDAYLAEDINPEKILTESLLNELAGDAGFSNDVGFSNDIGFVEHTGLKKDTGLSEDSGFTVGAGLSENSGFTVGAGLSENSGFTVGAGLAGDKGPETDIGHEQENEPKRIINTDRVIFFLWKAEPGWPVELVSENVKDLGYVPEDFSSGRIVYSDLIHPEDLEYVRAEVSRNSGGEQAYFNMGYRILTKSGSVCDVEERTFIRRNEQGEVTCYQGILLDITERKRAEAAHRLNEARLEALVKLNRMAGASLKEITDFAREEAVRLTGSKLGYLAFMDAYESTIIMHSWSKSAMEECAIEDKQFIYPLKGMGIWGEAVRQRKPVITNDYAAPNPLKKGYPENHVRLIRHMNIPVFDGERIVAVAGVGNKEEVYDESDVRQLTLLMQGMWQLIQRKQLEEALQTYSEELSRANEELSSVNVIKAEFMAETMFPEKAEYQEIIDHEALYVIDSQQQKAVNEFVHHSERLRRLVDSLLYMSQEQAGKINYSFKEVQVRKILSEAFLNNAFLINEKDLQVEKAIPSFLPEIKGDRKKLTALFTTLIDNAIKLTPEGGRLAVRVKEETENVHVVVGDSGKGISKELIPYLFHRFYQVNDSISRRYQGLESGLYICKNIVNAHKGEIWLESEEGVGSAVHVRLPK